MIVKYVIFCSYLEENVLGVREKKQDILSSAKLQKVN